VTEGGYHLYVSPTQVNVLDLARCHYRTGRHRGERTPPTAPFTVVDPPLRRLFFRCGARTTSRPARRLHVPGPRGHLSGPRYPFTPAKPWGDDRPLCERVRTAFRLLSRRAVPHRRRKFAPAFRSSNGSVSDCGFSRAGESRASINHVVVPGFGR